MIFGHQADSQADTTADAQSVTNDTVVPQMTPPNDLPATNDDLSSGGVLDQPADAQQPSGMPDLSAPLPDSTALSDESNSPTPAPQIDSPTSSAAPSPAPAPAFDALAPTPAPAGADDLLNLKQQALDDLAPLVDHLDQSPEEKFRTTMMMIQSTDNQALLKEAYQQAQAIPDEKVKAQALLDVVNEINYFTQKSQEG